MGAEDYKAGIYNAGWMVRHYERGGRSNIAKAQREQAILQLWLTVREACNNPQSDPETILAAIVDALRPLERSPF